MQAAPLKTDQTGSGKGLMNLFLIACWGKLRLKKRLNKNISTHSKFEQDFPKSRTDRNIHGVKSWGEKCWAQLCFHCLDHWSGEHLFALLPRCCLNLFMCDCDSRLFGNWCFQSDDAGCRSQKWRHEGGVDEEKQPRLEVTCETTCRESQRSSATLVQKA